MERSSVLNINSFGVGVKENWKDYFKLGNIHFMAYPECMKGEGPILETMSKLVESPHFEMIEVTRIKDPELRKKAKELLASSKMTLGYGAQPILLSEKLDLNSLDNTERMRAVDRIKECIDEADYLGAKSVAVLSGKNPAKEFHEQAKAALIDSLKELCNYAAKKKMRMVLESFDYDIDKCCLVGPSEITAEIAEKVRKEYPDFGIIYDLSHVPLLREDSKKALPILKDYLVHVHIGNCVMEDKSNPVYGDNHPSFCIPGGKNCIEELKYFLEALFEIGYLAKDKKERPTVSFEVKPMAGQNPEEVIASSVKTLEEAWGKL